MSQSDQHGTRQRTATLDDDQRDWLEERLVEYRDLLAYLREH
jgi:hypothetical protein